MSARRSDRSTLIPTQERRRVDGAWVVALALVVTFWSVVGRAALWLI
jgi:hypothetical protein